MHDAASLGRTPTIDELSVTLGVSRKEVQAALDETVLDIVPAADQLPEACLLADEQVRHLRAAVAHLPPRMRHVIEQVFFEGRSVTDVAAALGTTHSAVSQQKSEALRLLQDGLATPYADAFSDRDSAPVSRISRKRRAEYLSALDAALTPLRGHRRGQGTTTTVASSQPAFAPAS